MKSSNNNKNPLKIVGSTLIAFIMFGAAACSPDANVSDNNVYDPDYAVDNVSNADYDYFNEWDQNADQMWDEREFSAGIDDAGFYDGWDADNDNLYSENEFNDGLFNVWDNNNDGFLDSDEYTAGNGAWEDDFGNNFSSWDTNSDYKLDNNEFYSGVGTTGVYNTWDMDNDGFLTDDEFGTGLYSSWDNDRDGYIGYDEYNGIGFNDWGL